MKQLEKEAKYKDVTYDNIYDEYEPMFNEPLCKDRKNGYCFLLGLRDKGLMEAYPPLVREGKVLAYRLTDKAWEEERKAKALENLKALYDIMNKKMSPDMSLNADEEKALEEIEKVIE